VAIGVADEFWSNTMPRIYELPTHLQVEDVLIAGLTARQLLRLVVGASLAYGVWEQAVWLPQEVRLAAAAVLIVIGILVALLEPGGRPLDQWLLVGMLFVALPRRLVWRPGATPLGQPPRVLSGWAELSLHAGWVGSDQYDPDPQHVVVRRTWWRRRS
jgi:hypothetical protein